MNRNSEVNNAFYHASRAHALFSQLPRTEVEEHSHYTAEIAVADFFYKFGVAGTVLVLSFMIVVFTW